MMLRTDIVIVGAGVVGLAIARTLSRQYRGRAEIVLLEQHNGFGQETSSRNSEVIHAGLYYPPDSAKAHHCLRGRAMLYGYCRNHHIPHQRTGKLIVAHEGEHGQLQALYDNAIDSGVSTRALQWLGRSALRRLEPHVSADHALLSTHSGIVDSHALMQSLLDEARDHGMVWSPATRVERVATPDRGGEFVVHAVSGSDRTPVQLACRILINAAGIGAAGLASRIEGLDPETIPAIHVVKGHYFSWSGPTPFRHLIYPLPPRNGEGLGIHATLDLAGRLRFGPDAMPVNAPDYRVDESRRGAFIQAIARYFPAVDSQRLQPDYAGIRTRTRRQDPSGASDFDIRDASGQGLDGLIQLFGIESPGLTAALSIADEVSGYTADRLTRYGSRRPCSRLPSPAVHRRA